MNATSLLEEAAAMEAGVAETSAEKVFSRVCYYFISDTLCLLRLMRSHVSSSQTARRYHCDIASQTRNDLLYEFQRR